ncbi:MAG TPA: succinylglutamate desuccinylase/aspartoacylase family protein, partial [Bacillota bacterium]
MEKPWKPLLYRARRFVAGLAVAAVCLSPVAANAQATADSLREHLGESWQVFAIPAGSPEQQSRWVLERLADSEAPSAYLVLPAAAPAPADPETGNGEGNNTSPAPPADGPPAEEPPGDDPVDTGVSVETVPLLAGTPHETQLTVIRARAQGPAVLVVGGLHGDDPAGVEAARQLSRWRDLSKGTLLVIRELDRQAVASGRRYVDVDLNRAFPDRSGETPSDPRAQAVWQVLQRYSVDYLLDLHEDNRPWTSSNDIGNVLIYKRVNEHNEQLAQRMLAALNRDVSSSQRWRLGGPPIAGGLTRAAQDWLGVHAYYVSTARSNPLATRVAQHKRAVTTLLEALGMTGEGAGQPPAQPEPPRDPQQPPAQPPSEPPRQPEQPPAEEPAGSVTVRTILPGTDFETKLYVIDSGRPGPTVWISGGVHGSELAGWKAAEIIAQWRVPRGRLLVLPHANALGVKQQRREPSGYGDLNREFPTSGDRTPDSRLAQAIWDELQRYRPDWVLDLHEALGNRNLDSGSVGQTIIAWPSSGMMNMARTIIGRINGRLSSELDFQLLRYPVQG